ncbi:MAG: ClpXP protease specificity-enhancing factor [Burkholderiaceae bacterium]|nr:ClpXP protease specificity-enhancing factor [Burkholderiaceae bacterium]
MAEISTKPYLIRALYEWCSDNGYRPYIAVAVDERTLVPREFVRNGEIVLNISAAATNRLTIGNELLEFEARFGGVARQVSIPIENVSAIFAQENGHGMAFEVPKALALTPESGGDDAGAGQQALASDAAAGSDAASLPVDDEGAAGATTTTGRARKRPRLASVPASGEEAPKPGRRKTQIAAVPAATKPSADSATAAEPAPRDAAKSRTEAPASPAADADGSGDDEPGPGAPPSGRPHLKRVK